MIPIKLAKQNARYIDQDNENLDRRQFIREYTKNGMQADERYRKENPNYKELEKGNFDDYIYLCKQDSKFYLEPQSDYICDKDDNILVDHVLRYETLQEDFNKFWNLKLPHLNKSDRDKDWEKYYNENTIKTVYEFYKRDFKNFNYDTRTKRLG